MARVVECIADSNNFRIANHITKEKLSDRKSFVVGGITGGLRIHTDEQRMRRKEKYASEKIDTMETAAQRNESLRSWILECLITEQI